jgi:hypothetical protein
VSKFNPQRIEKLIISLRLPRDKVDLIDKLSSERDISRNEFLVKCIDYAVENLEAGSEKPPVV